MGCPNLCRASNLRLMRISNNQRLTLALTAAIGGAGAPLAAQVTLFPRAEAFEYPIGSIRAAGIVGRVVNVTRGETRYGAEREGRTGQTNQHGRSHHDVRVRQRRARPG